MNTLHMGESVCRVTSILFDFCSIILALLCLLRLVRMNDVMVSVCLMVVGMNTEELVHREWCSEYY